MVKNYFKIAARNMLKRKIYSAINISGLAVGMACVLLITLYIQDELSYDAYHEKANRIYRATVADEGESIGGWIGTPAPLAPALKQRFPEIEDYVRIDPLGFKGKVLLSHRDRSFYEEGFVLADPALFNVFSYKLLKGEPEKVLTDRSSLVVTQSIAEKYFGNENPIGKRLNFDSEMDFIVTGVMEDVPANSHIRFDIVASFEFLNEIHQRDIKDIWGMYNYYTYILLQDTVNPRTFEDKSAGYLAELADDPTARLYLQPLTDIYLRSKIARDPHHAGDITTVYLYAAIAVVILLIACINFMNLYTANSEIRAREVGMRKVLGAQKSQLFVQFLGEALVLSLLALPLAVLLAEVALPAFNQITEKALDIKYAGSFALYAGLLLLTTTVGLVSGSYPAFYLSAFQPVKILQGKLKSSLTGRRLRNVLVVFQFAISIALIVCSLLIHQQMGFIRNKKLGYDRENIVNVSIFGSESRDKYETFRNEILRHANIVDATATSFTPSVERWREGMSYEGRTEDSNLSFFRISGDFNFIDLFGMEIIAGRAFNRSNSTDFQYAYILNETAAREIGWTPEEAVGKLFGAQSRGGRIIGVVKDFHFRSLRREMHPLVINVSPRFFKYISIKIKPGDIANSIQFLESKWSEINPGVPFEYYFYDSEFDKLYKADNKLQALFGYFTFLSIFIACLGLFGLSLFMVQRRTKEVGIRKVLGASVPNIVGLISTDFVKLVVVANLVGWPIAYLSVTQWLQNFAYRIDIGWLIFVVSGVSAVLIALLTISAHTIKAALANPVKALRYE